MDLQLGLALPTNPTLNSDTYDPEGLFASFPLNHNSSTVHKKRSFSQPFEQNRDVLLPTLPLLPLTPGQPNDDEGPEEYQSSCSTVTKNDGEDDAEAVLGWPPVNSRRKKLRHDNSGLRGSSTNTLYVKVNMEGVVIARKVDLSLHHSFEKLKETLMSMFGKCHQHSNCYELAYQDEEGDWLLAEDVPWRCFIECAQRLKLLKSSG